MEPMASDVVQRSLLKDNNDLRAALVATRREMASRRRRSLWSVVTEAVDRVRPGFLPVREAVAGLLRREPRPEAH